MEITQQFDFDVFNVQKLSAKIQQTEKEKKKQIGFRSKQHNPFTNITITAHIFPFKYQSN